MTGIEWMLVGMFFIGVAVVVAALNISKRIVWAQHRKDEVTEVEDGVVIWPPQQNEALAAVLYGDDGKLYLLMPRAEWQGDEPVKVDATVLGARDASGRFIEIPRLDTVLRAATYAKSRGDDDATKP